MVTYFLRLICIFMDSFNRFWLELVLLLSLFLDLSFLKCVAMVVQFFFSFFFPFSVNLIFLSDYFLFLLDDLANLRN